MLLNPVGAFFFSVYTSSTPGHRNSEQPPSVCLKALLMSWIPSSICSVQNYKAAAPQFCSQLCSAVSMGIDLSHMAGTCTYNVTGETSAGQDPSLSLPQSQYTEREYQVRSIKQYINSYFDFSLTSFHPLT